MRLTQLLTAMTLMTALAVPLTLAQPGPPEAQTREIRPSLGFDDPQIGDLEFPGGTVEEFVMALRKAAGDQPVNIVYDAQAAKLSVPSVSLREVDAYTALRSACEPASRTLTHFDDGRIFSWTVTKIAGDASSVYTIHARDVSPPQFRPGYQAPQPHRSTAIHTITELITGPGAMTADDVLSALQAALAMEDGNEVKLAYHEGTGLVFARVTAEQGRVIESAILNLRVSRDARQRSEDHNVADALLRRLNVANIDEAIANMNRIEHLRQENIQLKEQIGKLSEQIVALRAASSQPPR